MLFRSQSDYWLYEILCWIISYSSQAKANQCNFILFFYYPIIICSLPLILWFIIFYFISCLDDWSNWFCCFSLCFHIRNFNNRHDIFTFIFYWFFMLLSVYFALIFYDFTVERFRQNSNKLITAMVLSLYKVFNCNFVIIKLCLVNISSVDWGYRIHRLHLCREVDPLPTKSILDTTLNHLMVRLQPWRFRECGVPLHCHYSQVHSNSEW